MPSFTLLKFWSLVLNVGYNKYILNPPISCKQGSFLSLYLYYGSTARVAMNYANAPYGDLVLTNVATVLTKINTVYTSKLYVNALIGSKYYLTKFSLSKYFPSFQNLLVKNVSASFVNSPVAISRIMVLKNCKLLFQF
jgi:hypothetical protein